MLSRLYDLIFNEGYCQVNVKGILFIVIALLIVACQPVVEIAEPAASSSTNTPDTVESEEAVPETAVTEPVEPTTTPPATQPEPTSTTETVVETETNGAMNGNADVTFVRAVQNNEATWTFYVTVAHPDTGWEDYADGWDVLLPDGSVIKPDESSDFTRLLLHPHVEEQPFTRSQSGIIIPSEVSEVRVRAHDLVDGFGGREVVVDLMVESGEDFSVERVK